MHLAAFVSESLMNRTYGKIIQEKLETLKPKLKKFAHNHQFNRFARTLDCEVYTPIKDDPSVVLLPDMAEGRRGNYACLWNCTHAIFFWDYTEDAVADTIRVAYRLRRRLYVTHGTDDQLFLIHRI